MLLVSASPERCRSCALAPELDLGIGFQVVQTESGEVGDDDVARQVALRQSLEIVRGLVEGAIEVLICTLVLDQKHPLPERVNAPMPQFFGGSDQLHLLFEDGDAAALDAKHAEEIVPEALRLRTLGCLAFPLAGEGERAALDLVPGKRHVRQQQSALGRASGGRQPVISIGEGRGLDACRA